MMDAATLATLAAWRSEIEAELEVARADLAASRAALETSIAEESRERDRIAALAVARNRVPLDIPLANALRHRFEAAAKLSAGCGARGHGSAVDAGEFKVRDLEEAIAQIDAMLRPPAPVLTLVDGRQSVAGADTFDPIVMSPARVA